MRMTVDEMIAVLQAYKEGKEIEIRHITKAPDNTGWQRTAYPEWNFSAHEFRVKQVPREFFLVIADNGKPISAGTANRYAVIPAGISLQGLSTIKVREVLE